MHATGHELVRVIYIEYLHDNSPTNDITNISLGKVIFMATSKRSLKIKIVIKKRFIKKRH